MNYSEPKVTIDLKEYTGLLETKNNPLPENEDNKALAILTKIVYEEPRIMNMFIDALNRFNITMIIENNLSPGLPKIITKKKN